MPTNTIAQTPENVEKWASIAKIWSIGMTAGAIRAERIVSGLQPRTWSFNRQPEVPARQMVLLTDGTGFAETGSEGFDLVAPVILWLGDLKPGRLRVAAGATGYRGWAGETVVASAIGDQPESISLRYLADRDFLLSLAGRAETGVLSRCFADLVDESARDRDAASLAVSGILRVMFVALLRVSAGHVPELSPSGGRATLLQRFRRLVEMNYRSHWAVSQYASALGISTDRLHAICSAGVGKSPKVLISERLAQEAAIRLQRSSLTIQQLAHALGFNDPAHFSHFFRKMMGVAPGAYRRTLAEPETRGTLPARTFADWP